MLPSPPLLVSRCLKCRLCVLKPPSTLQTLQWVQIQCRGAEKSYDILSSTVSDLVRTLFPDCALVVWCWEYIMEWLFSFITRSTPPCSLVFGMSLPSLSFRYPNVVTSNISYTSVWAQGIKCFYTSERAQTLFICPYV